MVHAERRVKVSQQVGGDIPCQTVKTQAPSLAQGPHETLYVLDSNRMSRRGLVTSALPPRWGDDRGRDTRKSLHLRPWA